MKKVQALLFAVLFFVFIARAAPTAAEQDNPEQDGHGVTTLIFGDNDVDKLSEGEWFLFIFRPTCPHCKIAVPVINLLDNELKADSKSKTKVASVNLEHTTVYGDLFELKGIPAFFFVKDGMVREYTGSRKKEDIEAFIETKYREVTPRGHISELKKSADERRKQREVHFDKEENLTELSGFDLDYLQNGSWLFLIYAPWCGHCKRLFPTWTGLAQSNALGDVKMAQMNGELFEEYAAKFDSLGFPTILFIKDRMYYKYTGNRTKEDIIDFVKGGYEKKEKLPLPFLGPPNSILLGVNNSTCLLSGEWMVLVYAPWCGHCKRVLPTWEALADAKEMDGISVAKVNTDLEENANFLFEIEEFPTIYRYSDGQVFKYSGSDRSYAKLLEFAKGGYLKVKPFSRLVGPSSLFRRAGSKYIGYVLRLLAVLERHGISQNTFAMCAVGLCIVLFIITAVLIVLIIRLNNEQHSRDEKLSEYLEKSIDLDDVGTQLLSMRKKPDNPTPADDKSENSKSKPTQNEKTKSSSSSSSEQGQPERRRNGKGNLGKGKRNSESAAPNSVKESKKENKKNK